MSPTFCPQCGSRVAADDRFCASCGSLLEQAVAALAAEEASALPPLLASAGPVRSLREIYFELGLRLFEFDRAREALAAFESARKEPGPEPPDADLLLALAAAAQDAEQAEQAMRYLLDAALVADPPRQQEIVDHLLGSLTASTAVSNGHWLVQHWWPSYRNQAGAADEALRGQLLVARTQLFLANYDEAEQLLRAAAALDGQATRAEVARMLAADKLPPALASANAEAARVIACIWQAVGDPGRALGAVDQALAAVSGSGYPDAPLLALRADLLLALDRRDEAANDLHRAGERYLWRKEPAIAAKLFERLIALAPANVEARWSLADALLVTSFGPALADADRLALLARARHAWKDGLAVRAPGKSDAWAYATLAYITTREGELGDSTPREPAYWQAVALIERALLLNPTGARWGNLCEFHRRLMNQQMALVAARRGHELEPQATDPLTELVIILTNIGHWDEARAALEKLEAISKSPWTAFVASRLLLYGGQSESALARIDEALQAEPSDLTYLATRALVLREAGRYDDSREVARAILERYRLDDRDNLVYFASAALECGDNERALQAYEKDLANAGDVFYRESCQRNLAFAYLALGDLKRARAAIDAGTRSAIDAEGRWLFARDLRDFEHRTGPASQSKALASELDRFRKRIEALPQNVVASAREEMESALKQGGSSQWQTVAALAGLARLDCEDSDFATAARRYAELQANWSPQFLEAPLGIDAAVNGLHKVTEVADYWALRDRTPRPEPWQQRFFDTYPATRLGLAPERAATAGRPLDVTPIAIEMDDSLLPSGDADEWPIIKTYLPDMRARIARDTGVKIPGTRLRGNSDGDLAPDRFLLMLAEVPLLMPRVVKDAAYCRAGAERAGKHGVRSLQDDTDPLDGSPGCWIEPSDESKLKQAGIEVLDPHAFIVRHLEALVRRNLVDFLGVDEVDSLLESWQSASDHTAEIERLRNNDELLLRFTRLLRRLAREQVSIASGAPLLDAVAECGLDDVGATLRAARRRLARQPGAVAPPGRRVPLPADVEAHCLSWLHEVGDRTFFALPPEDAQEILGEVRSLVAQAPPRPVIVVESALLRPHLRDLLELEFANLPVIAAEELAGAPAPLESAAS